MWENTQAHKTRKWIDNRFAEGADYNYKRYLITNKTSSARNINNDCKQIKCMPLWFSETC